MGEGGAATNPYLQRESVSHLPFLTQKGGRYFSTQKRGRFTLLLFPHKEGNSLFYLFHTKGEILLVGGKDANSGANSQNY